MKFTGADHTSFTVSNLDQSLAFYQGLLGFELIHLRPKVVDQYFRDILGMPDSVVKAAFLKIPGTDHRLELFEYAHPRGVKADVRTNNFGSAHLCLLVDDLRAAHAELSVKGVAFRSPPIALNAGPNKGGYAVYMLDPDGISIELFQRPT